MWESDIAETTNPVYTVSINIVLEIGKRLYPSRSAALEVNYSLPF